MASMKIFGRFCGAPTISKEDNFGKVIKEHYSENKLDNFYARFKDFHSLNFIGARSNPTYIGRKF